MASRSNPYSAQAAHWRVLCSHIELIWSISPRLIWRSQYNRIGGERLTIRLFTIQCAHCARAMFTVHFRHTNTCAAVGQLPTMGDFLGIPNWTKLAMRTMAFAFKIANNSGSNQDFLGKCILIHTLTTWPKV